MQDFRGVLDSIVSIQVSQVQMSKPSANGFQKQYHLRIGIFLFSSGSRNMDAGPSTIGENSISAVSIRPPLT